MTLTIQLPDQWETLLQAQAHARGVSPDSYILHLLERDLISAPALPESPPFKTGRGLLSSDGPAPSREEIDANRAEMFKSFAENF